MLISLKWLNEYIDIKDKEIPELENALTMIGPVSYTHLTLPTTPYV